MALTPSTMIPLQTSAPDFTLPEPRSGQTLTLQECRGEKGTLVIFMCNHCPFVVHVLDGIVALARDYQQRQIEVVAISSNDISTHPEDAPEKMAQLATTKSFSFPYLYDATQAVAKAYEAACTPDFFLFNAELACVYRGQMDGARPGNNLPVDGRDLRQAMDALLADTAISADQTPSMGCNIKWK